MNTDEQPNIIESSRPWAKKENLTLVTACKRLGDNWAEIAKLLPGKTQTAVEMHLTSLVEKFGAAAAADTGAVSAASAAVVQHSPASSSKRSSPPADHHHDDANADVDYVDDGDDDEDDDGALQPDGEYALTRTEVTAFAEEIEQVERATKKRRLVAPASAVDSPPCCEPVGTAEICA
jgi:hypothetical protein